MMEIKVAQHCGFCYGVKRAVELAQGLCSTAAVILTVPAAAAIGGAYYGKHPLNQKSGT